MVDLSTTLPMIADVLSFITNGYKTWDWRCKWKLSTTIISVCALEWCLHKIDSTTLMIEFVLVWWCCSFVNIARLFVLIWVTGVSIDRTSCATATIRLVGTVSLLNNLRYHLLQQQSAWCYQNVFKHDKLGYWNTKILSQYLYIYIKLGPNLNKVHWAEMDTIEISLS